MREFMKMDIIVMFAKLWGMETADSRLHKEKYLKLESYDSQELYEMFYEWKEEYLEEEDVPEDLCEFFEMKMRGIFEE